MNYSTLVRHKSIVFYEVHNMKYHMLGIVVRKKGYGNVTVLWSDGKLRTVHGQSLRVINELWYRATSNKIDYNI